MFLFTEGSVCRAKRFTIGLRNSRTFGSRRPPYRDCNWSKCASGGSADSSWQQDNDRQCSKCTRVFPWFSIQHNASCRKHPGQLVRGLLLHHDNARPHTALAIQGRIKELQWELLEHPPYPSDVARSDLLLFDPLKYHIGGKRFSDDEEVETEVRKWLRALAHC
jgi:hypothetical protein